MFANLLGPAPVAWLLFCLKLPANLPIGEEFESAFELKLFRVNCATGTMNWYRDLADFISVSPALLTTESASPSWFWNFGWRVGLFILFPNLSSFGCSWYWSPLSWRKSLIYIVFGATWDWVFETFLILTTISSLWLFSYLGTPLGWT